MELVKTLNRPELGQMDKNTGNKKFFKKCADDRPLYYRYSSALMYRRIV